MASYHIGINPKMSTSSESSSEDIQECKTWAKGKRGAAAQSRISGLGAPKDVSSEDGSSIEDNYSGDASGEGMWEGAADEPLSDEAADAGSSDDEAEDVEEAGPAKLIEQVIHIRGDQRVLSDIMSVFELSSVITVRINQIETNNNAFCSGKYGSARDMAVAELRERMCPLELLRTKGIYRGIKYVEVWSPNEMVLPDQLSEMV